MDASQNSLRVLRALLLDVEQSTGVPTDRDFARIRDRVRDEGLSFLTITLPAFCKAFELCLEQGICERSSFPGFRFSRGAPKFLGGLFALIFDGNGLLLSCPCVNSIMYVRQICLLYKKLRLPCSPEREQNAFRKYEECDDELGSTIGIDLNAYSRVCALVLGSCLSKVDLDCYQDNLFPRFGPGAVAEKATANGRYNVQDWPERLDAAFPLDVYRLASMDYEERGAIKLIPRERELPVRVICVPKTLKSPRIIAIEPSYMQYAQQGVMRLLYDALEGPYGLPCIRFTDQTVNRLHALSSSHSKSHATIDLSEASDRVRLDVVCAMLKQFPSLLAKVLACRSTTAKLPDGKLVYLKKFASMGSALCFPIESMVFSTLIIYTMLKRGGKRPTTGRIKTLMRQFCVYGDDIVVPTSWTQDVIAGLEVACLKVNADKSFSKGNFRESCGMDAYDGHDITSRYIRHLEPNRITDVDAIANWLSLSNQFHASGYWYVADYMKTVVERLCGRLPLGDGSAYLSLTTFQGVREGGRYSRTLHRPLIKGLGLVHKFRSDPLDGYGALRKFFLKSGLPLAKDHLRTSGRPVSSQYKRRWFAV